MKIKASLIKVMRYPGGVGFSIDLPDDHYEEAVEANNYLQQLVQLIGTDNTAELLHRVDSIKDTASAQDVGETSIEFNSIGFNYEVINVLGDGFAIHLDSESEEVNVDKALQALERLLPEAHYEDNDFDEDNLDVPQEDADDIHDQVVEATGNPDYEAQLDTKIEKLENEDKDRVSSGDAEHVNSPQHYQHIVLAHDGKNPQTYEAIDIIEGVLESLQLSPFGSDCVGNTLKYIFRAPYKGREAEDLSKGAWYLSRYADRLNTPDQGETEDDYLDFVSALLEDLINDFLDTYKVDAGDLEFDSDNLLGVEVDPAHDYSEVHTTREPIKEHQSNKQDTDSDKAVKDLLDLFSSTAKKVEDMSKGVTPEQGQQVIEGILESVLDQGSDPDED